MLFDYAGARAGQSVLINGAAGNVGAYAVQLAKQAGLHVIATVAAADSDYVQGLGAETIVDYKRQRFEESVSGVDVVLDTVGGETQEALASGSKARRDPGLQRVTRSRGDPRQDLKILRR